MASAQPCLLSTELTAETVAERFRQAKRSGRPSWLWPDIAIDTWREALECIAEITRHALAGRSAPVPLTGDSVSFGLACYTSGMGPLLDWWHRQGLLRASDGIAAVLDLHGRHNRARHRRLAAFAADIVQRLEEAGIAVALLKGLHTAAAYFPAPGTRPMADIDLLVAQEDAAVAGQVLANSGMVSGARGFRETHWRPYPGRTQPLSLLHVHEDDPWSIDLHYSLDQFVAAGAPLVRFDEVCPFKHAERSPDLLGARVLGHPLLLLHLAAHAGGALHNLTLLRLVEIHLVIRQDEAAGRLSWRDFIETGAGIDALGYAYPALKLCEELIPGTVPQVVLDRCAASTPPRVVRVVARLTPATAQRVDRNSVAEHFMWTTGWRGTIRQIAADIAPATRSWRTTCSIYERRAWQLLRGRIEA